LVFFMLIGAEMIGTGAGLGWFMHNAGATYQVPRIYASGALIVLLGVLLHGALGAIEKLRFRPRRLFTATALFLVALAAGAQPVLEIDRLGADASHGPHHGCGSVDLDRVNPADLERIGREMVEGRR
jgi:NitT/TauT family transport system permease protein